MCKQKTKKVYRFLQQKKKKKKFDVHTVNKKKSKESTQILTIRKKKMINVHTVKKKKKSTQILMCTL